MRCDCGQWHSAALAECPACGRSLGEERPGGFTRACYLECLYQVYLVNCSGLVPRQDFLPMAKVVEAVYLPRRHRCVVCQLPIFPGEATDTVVGAYGESLHTIHARCGHLDLP